MGPGTGIRRIWKAAALVAVGAAGGGAALAVASVPSSNGVISACYQIDRSGNPVTTGPNLRVIDPGIGQTCDTTTSVDGVPGTESNLSWNQTGPPGARGPAGRSVTIAGGNTLTLSGGAVVTVGGTPGAVTITSPPITPQSRPIGTVTLDGTSTITFSLYSFQMAQAHGSGGGAGRSKVGEIALTKKLDKSSPLLSQACASGKHFPNATITVSKGGKGGKQGSFYTYHLTDVMISSYQLNNHGKTPTDALTLDFVGLKIKTS